MSSDYTDLLEQARKSRLVLVKDLVAALEAEIAENKRQRTLLMCAASDLASARGFIETSTGEDPTRLQATEARMVEVFGPRDEANQD
jgi:hypothetical protein